MTTYHEVIFNIIWYTVEFIVYLCIIAYVLDHFGLIKAGLKPKKDVSATFGNTWKDTTEMLTTAAELATKVRTAMADPTATKAIEAASDSAKK